MELWLDAQGGGELHAPWKMHVYTRARVFERTRSTTVLEVADAVAMMDAMQKIIIFER